MAGHASFNSMNRFGRLPVILVCLGLASSGMADGIADPLSAEIARSQKQLEALPSSPFVDSERPRVQGQLDDALNMLKANRVSTALESFSSAIPGVSALARAGTGWDDTGKGPGKGIDILAREWEEVGRIIQRDRPEFTTPRPGGQSLFIRALAEQSFGQIDEHYAVAVDYGRYSGVTSGAYYLGRSEGHLALALFLSRLEAPPSHTVPTLSSLAMPINRVESDLVSAYARPGSTAQHANFILANSSLKLAKELNDRGSYRGALVTLLRSLFALTLATTPAPGASEEPVLAARADELARTFAASNRDESIGEAFVEKARIALEKCRAGGENAERERLRALALLDTVVPRYIEIMKGLKG
jgi:hypothetical protein